MSSDLEKISTFIAGHHVMSLATVFENELSVCSLFYAYDASTTTFIVASSDETTHIQHIEKNSNIAGNILLETKSVGKIQGVQFRGEFVALEDKSLQKEYFKAFPYALALKPKLWQIKVKYFKLTDNRLGFGKKIIWQELSL
jgi:uncharacterized protein YhbP (UPF0306 family)